MSGPWQALRVLAPVLLAAAAALLALGLVSLPPTARLAEPAELATLDWRVRSAARPGGAPVALVLFDSASVEEWPYLSPFPRAALASLVDVVAGAGARVVVLDVYLDRRYPALEALDGGDTRLRDAIARAGNVVLPGRTEWTATGRVLLPPDPFFAAHAAAVATADLPTPYETIRDATLLTRTRSSPVAGLPLAAAALWWGWSPDSLLAAAGRSGTLALPTLPTPLARLRPGQEVLSVPLTFLGPPSRPGQAGGAFPAFSAHTLLRYGAALPADWFRGKIVLLGTGFHAEDRYRSPFYEAADSSGTMFGWTYGAEVMATAVANLLTGTFPVPLEARTTLGLLFLLSLAVAAATVRRGVVAGTAIALVVLPLYWASAWWAFAEGSRNLPLIAPSLAVAIALGVAAGYVSLTEGRQKRVIRGAFARYLSPLVVDELLRDPRRLVLGGERREVTVLFSDLVGFTRLSEEASPERLLVLLNRYLDEMTRLVLAERGTLDKFTGDGLMAIFGAPAALPDHAERACVAALRMQRRLRELNAEWAEAGWPELRMRIGIHTGTPVVGNIGGEHRFDYTALGDDVNLASRLESACKEYGVHILVSDRVVHAAGGRIETRELDTIAVYGRSAPLRIYELLDPARPTARTELRSIFEQGTRAYRSRDFPLALRLFRAAEQVDPEDAPTRLYLRRVERLIDAPPPPEWDFVERRTTK